MAGTPGWGALPMAPGVRTLADAPNELPNARRGLVYCRIGVWRTGSEYDARECGAAARADHYRAAVLDLDGPKLSVVFKNYY